MKVKRPTKSDPFKASMFISGMATSEVVRDLQMKFPLEGIISQNKINDR